MFKFLKKGAGEIPPDIGQEEEVESTIETSDIESGIPELKKIEQPLRQTFDEGSDLSRLEAERLNAKVEGIVEWIKQFYERFAYVSESIGAVKAMNLKTEEELAKLSVETSKAIDIVKEVEPDKLRIDYQKLETKISAAKEKSEANAQVMEDLMSEIKDLRKKAGVFIGTEGILKLNEEVKKDLIEIQKVSARVRGNAEKTEQIFIELKSRFAESQKMSEIVNTLDTNYSGVKKEMEKQKIDLSNIVSIKNFESFKKAMNNKVSVFEGSLSEMELVKKENEKISELIETVANVSRQNKADIADIAVTIGDDKVQRVSDYENQLASILNILDTLAGEIANIKEKVGMKEKKKITVTPRKVLGKNGVKMKNMDIHPDVSDKLMVKNESDEKLEESSKVREQELAEANSTADLQEESNLQKESDDSSKSVVDSEIISKLNEEIEKINKKKEELEK